MDIAIIGLPQSGKTATFKALTSGHATTEGGSAGPVQVGVVKVVDQRLSVLGQMYHPRKVVYAEIKFWDLPPAPADRANRAQALSGSAIATFCKGADSLLLAVRAFEDDLRGAADPARDLAEMLNELALADLETLERAETRFADALRKTRPAERPAVQSQADAVRKVKDALESGIRMRQQELSPSERLAMTDYQLLTDKPIVVAFNTGESDDAPTLTELGLPAKMTAGLGEVQLCARLEEDLALMSDDEADEFRDALGISQSAVERVKQVCYDTVGLVSFLTVGDDEVRAWPVRDGIPALDAAGTIHTDFTRGFIRAEVIHFDDLVRCGSVAQGRKEGVLRSEGKTYPVKDGDVINFLVNV